MVRKSHLQWTKAQFDVARDTKGVGQWYHRSDSGRRDKDVVESIFDPQKKWPMEKDPRLYSHQYLFQGYQIQDGRRKNVGSSIRPRHVVSESRHKGSIPPYKGGCRVNELLMLQIRRPLLSLQRYAFRDQDGPANIFKNNAPMHGGCSTPMGGRSSAIYRRHMDRSQRQGVFRKSGSRDSRVSDKARMADKYGEIGSNTTKDVYISRMAMGLSKDDDSFGRREGTQSQADGASVESTCQERKNSSHQSFSLSDRQVISDKIAVCDSKSLLIRVKSAEDSSSQKKFVEWSSATSGIDTEGLELVEREAEGESAHVIEDTCSPSRDLDRCLPFWMGSAGAVQGSEGRDGGISSSWTLGQQVEFQSKGTCSGEGGSHVLSDSTTNELRPSLVSPYGQLYNSLQHQQESSESHVSDTNETVVQLPIPIRYDDKSSSCQGDRECKGRQFVEDEQIRGLQISTGTTSLHITDMGSTDINGPICVQDELSTRGILHTVEYGQEELRERCVQHTLVRKGDPPGTPPFTSSTEMFAKDKRGETSSSSDCSVLVRTGVDPDIEDDDSEDDSDGRVEVVIVPRKVNDKTSGQTTTRFDSGIFSGRRNNEGQQVVLALLHKRGLSDVSEWFFRSVAESTWRNYRRGFTLFDRLLRRSGVDPLSIENVDMAVASLIRALKVACDLKVRLSTIFLMKTAVVRLFSFMFNTDLSHMPMVKMALRCLTLNEMPRREMLRLQWSVDQLLIYLTKLPFFAVMEFNQLTAVTVVLCMAFTALRFSELYSLDIQETLPNVERTEWKFWVHVKGHDVKEPVIIHKVSDAHLDPVDALWTLRSKVYGLLAARKEKPLGFWYKSVNEEYVRLTYDGIRAAAVLILHQAGIRENRPYHIKHAVLTCLHESGTSAKDIAAFARHRLESMAAYHHYISYDAGKMSVKNIAESVKRVSHPN
jgi:hypothetical protein